MDRDWQHGTTVTHPIRFGQTWFPANELVHAETGPASWPWQPSAVSNTFRVMSFLDRDGGDKVVDAKWAAAINIWRDWANAQGGICMGSTDFQVSGGGCQSGTRKMVNAPLARHALLLNDTFGCLVASLGTTSSGGCLVAYRATEPECDIFIFAVGEPRGSRYEVCWGRQRSP